MATILIILACILFIVALVLLWRSIVLSPACAYLGMLALNFATSKEGYPVLPINSTILFAWLYITIVVMVATVMQAAPLRHTTKGVGYMLMGAVVGMAVGLLGFTFASSLSVVYGTMIVATAAGCFFGYLLYTNTPDGRPIASVPGHLVKYFLAKAFPIAITVMQIGVVAVLTLAIYQHSQP